MVDDTCPFCIADSRVLAGENDFAFAIRDKFPVRPLHRVVIPKWHVADIFETSLEEREALHQLALEESMNNCGGR
jgi:diadenosine tetraphosphate (Ap4A) HIT family hydrolase